MRPSVPVSAESVVPVAFEVSANSMPAPAASHSSRKLRMSSASSSQAYLTTVIDPPPAGETAVGAGVGVGAAPRGMLYQSQTMLAPAGRSKVQAVVSGAFSLARQAVQLGYNPRVKIDHTSEREIDEIYIPGVNWFLMLSCIGLVLRFQSSSNLAAAYGIAVTTTMVITSVLLYVVAHERWGWNPLTAGLLIVLFLSVDLGFFGANVIKIPHGGWFPLVIAWGLFILMLTWQQGRRILSVRLRANALPIEEFLTRLADQPPQRVPGTAIFMYGQTNGTPPALLLNLRHNKVLHERVVLLTVITAEIPHVALTERLELEKLGEALNRITIHYGFLDDPDVPKALEETKRYDLELPPARHHLLPGS